MVLNFPRPLGGYFFATLVFFLAWSASPLEAASPEESFEQGLKMLMAQRLDELSVSVD